MPGGNKKLRRNTIAEDSDDEVEQKTSPSSASSSADSGSGDDPSYEPEQVIAPRKLRSSSRRPVFPLAVRARGGLVAPPHGGGAALWKVGQHLWSGGGWAVAGVV